MKSGREGIPGYSVIYNRVLLLCYCMVSTSCCVIQVGSLHVNPKVPLWLYM